MNTTNTIPFVIASLHIILDTIKLHIFVYTYSSALQHDGTPGSEARAARPQSSTGEGSPGHTPTKNI